ncbi:MAG: hypothetical protein K8T90_09315 [Planctomycetes bacterium]|nr:hypothetical protein [Planctomycetota bacterium]
MSTISCPRCGSAFPLAQVAQFDQFTCGACGAIVPVPIASPAALPPVQPRAVAPAPRPAAAPIPQPRPAAQSTSTPRPAAQPTRPASGPVPQAPRPAAAPTARPSVPTARPAARPEGPPPTIALPPSALRAQHAKPAAAAPTRTPAPIRVAEPIVEEDDENDAPRGRRGKRGADDRDEPKKKSPMPLVLAGVGVLVLVIGGIVVVKGRSKGGDPAVASAGAAADQPKVAADPEKDPAAWKALTPEDRKSRAQMKAVNVDAKQESQAKVVFDFLMARDEKDIALNIARDVTKARPDVEWPHLALGHQDLRDLYEKTVKENPWADGLSTDPMVELQRLKKANAPKTGPWWGDEETQKRVSELVAQIVNEEKTLSTPFGQGVAKWVNYHKSIEVMKDFPSIYATTGPYLIFVSLPVAADKLGKATLADVSPENMARGKEVLERTTKLYETFYDVWHSTFDGPMGLTRFGPENTDQEKILLIQVFLSGDDYARYNALTGGPGGGVRAYYSSQEPRFVVTYDGTKTKSKDAPAPGAHEISEDPFEDPEHVQCHEGTHQLVHFHTWDTTRKALGRSPEWLQCNNRKLWFNEGFAEFCSTYKKEGDKYVFFQPLESRMFEIWCIGEIVKERGWEDWKLKELLDPNHSGQLASYGQARTRRPGEEGLAQNAMANLYYGKVWSLVYYLWNFEEGGKPKFRDRFVKFTKDQFTVKLMKASNGIEYPKYVDAKDFRTTFGLESDAAFTAFEKDWKAWEADYVAKAKTPKWDVARLRLRNEIWGLDKNPVKPVPPKDPPKKK